MIGNANEVRAYIPKPHEIWLSDDRAKFGERIPEHVSHLMKERQLFMTSPLHSEYSHGAFPPYTSTVAIEIGTRPDGGETRSNRP